MMRMCGDRRCRHRRSIFCVWVRACIHIHPESRHHFDIFCVSLKLGAFREYFSFSSNPRYVCGSIVWMFWKHYLIFDFENHSCAFFVSQKCKKQRRQRRTETAQNRINVLYDFWDKRTKPDVICFASSATSSSIYVRFVAVLHYFW